MMNSAPHCVILDNQRSLRVSGVNDVEMYSENKVVLNTSAGELVIKGRKLHIDSLEAETGDFTMGGLILSISYNRFDSSENPVIRMFR